MNYYQDNLLALKKTGDIVAFHKMLVEKCGFVEVEDSANFINERDFKNGILTKQLSLKLNFGEYGKKGLSVYGVYKPNN